MNEFNGKVYSDFIGTVFDLFIYNDTGMPEFKLDKQADMSIARDNKHGRNRIMVRSTALNINVLNEILLGNFDNKKFTIVGLSNIIDTIEQNNFHALGFEILNAKITNYDYRMVGGLNSSVNIVFEFEDLDEFGMNNFKLKLDGEDISNV